MGLAAYVRSVGRHLADDYRCYRHPLMQQGFLATAIHRVFHPAGRVRPWLPRKLARGLHAVFIKLSEVFFGIYIGMDAVIGRRFKIEHFGGVIINSRARIGDNVRVRHGVTIGNAVAERPEEVPVIGDDVDIGAHAVILGRIHVGDRAVVGANAVVIRDVPADSIAVGVPARVKPKRPAAVPLALKAGIDADADAAPVAAEP